MLVINKFASIDTDYVILQKYQYESRHRHAQARARGVGGKFGGKQPATEPKVQINGKENLTSDLDKTKITYVTVIKPDFCN